VLPRRHGSARRRDRAAYAAAVALGVRVTVRPAEEGFQPTARALIPRPRIGVRRVTAESGGGGSLASRLHLRDAIKDRPVESGKLFGRRVGLHRLSRWSPMVRVGIAHPSRRWSTERASHARTKSCAATERMPETGRVILSDVRDPRLITIRRGGSLEDDDHHRLAVWAATCAEHVLHHFERARPDDERPRRAIELARAWARGEVAMTEARTAAGHANAAARDLRGAARHAGFAAAQAAAVAHVASHELGAAAYAIKAVRAAVPDAESENAGRLECRWQRERLPQAIRDLVLDDQRIRNEICWSVFET